MTKSTHSAFAHPGSSLRKMIALNTMKSSHNQMSHIVSHTSDQKT